MKIQTGEVDQYKAEVKEKWGQTDAYKEYQSRQRSPETEQSATAGMDAIFGEFALCMDIGEAADSAAAQTLVQKLRQYITDNFYTCTPQILSGLGQMYVADERFKSNMDKHADGTAAFIREAIEVYCRK